MIGLTDAIGPTDLWLGLVLWFGLRLVVTGMQKYITISDKATEGRPIGVEPPLVFRTTCWIRTKLMRKY